MTIDPYIVGSVVVSLLGFLLFSAVAKSTRTRSEERSDVVEKTKVGRRSGEAEDAAEVIIVGAGVAGAALAHTLGKEGRRVRVIERDLIEPDRIVGELLQPGGYLKLIELGLEENIDAQMVLGYALFKDGKNTRLSCPLDKFHSDVAGRSFHNGRFIQRMREKAASLPKYISFMVFCSWSC